MLKKKNLKLVVWNDRIYKFKRSDKGCSDCLFSKIGLRNGMNLYPCSRDLIYGLDGKVTTTSYLCHLYPGYTLVKLISLNTYINNI